MERMARIVIPASVLALLFLSFAPAASASTLTVDLNPSTGVATMTSTSVSNIVLTYPANSTLSGYLKGYSDNSSTSGNFTAGSQGVTDFEGHFHDDDGSGISIKSMSVTTSYTANANSTTLVIAKQTVISTTVSGVFKVVNGTVTADLGWRSFRVDGALDLALHGHVLDVNLLGSSVTSAISGRGTGEDSVISMFGEANLWNAPTLNFSSLNTPLTNWTKSYNSISNTTTFSKTISGQSSLSATYTNNGQTYSLKETSDPSAVIATQGYADASANSLTIVPTPIYLSPVVWAEGAFLGALAVFATVVIARSRRRPAGVAELSQGASPR
jgi:hypothetical protein